MLSTKRHLFIPLLALLWVSPVELIAQEQGQDNQLKTTMHSAFQALSYLIDEALDKNSEGHDKENLKTALQRIESASVRIAEHSESAPRSFNLVAASLGSVVDQMVRNYQVGLDQLGEAYLVETIDHCAACHAQSPEIEGTIDLNGFVQRIKNEELDTSVAAQMLIAVRRFSDASALWEKKLTNEMFSLGVNGAEEELLEYVFQAIHTNGKKERLDKTLDVLQHKQDTPHYMMLKIAKWREQIKLIDNYQQKTITLEKIKSINSECRQIEGRSVREKFPVCNMIESSLSATMLRQSKDIDSAKEGALYLNMGIARMNTMVSTGLVPQVEHFLEAAILAAPGTETAISAYANLEELAYFYYGDLKFAEEVMGLSFEGLKKFAGIIDFK